MAVDLAIETQDLVKRFSRARVAVDRVSLSVPCGSVYGLVGPNGAGKTTFMRALLGFTPITSGRAQILGRRMPAERRTVYPEVGVMIEEPRFYPFLSGRRNLLQIARLLGIGTARVDQLLDEVGLGGRADDRVRDYSLGMRQRLGIARALLADPQVLLLDEPVNGLDPPGIRDVRHLLRRLADEGRTVLISSHLLGELELMCDHVALLQEGKLVADGPIEHFGVSHPTLRIDVVDASRAAEILDALDGVEDVELRGSEVYIRYDGASGRAAAYNRALVEAGVDVTRLHPLERSLEERFLEMTGGDSGSGTGREDGGS